MLRFMVSIAVGCAAAHVLLTRDLPESMPLRDRLLDARALLMSIRARAREAMQAGSQASRDSEQELLTEYHRRSGRIS